jgi:hypothetical protein
LIYLILIIEIVSGGDVTLKTLCIVFGDLHSERWLQQPAEEEAEHIRWRKVRSERRSRICLFFIFYEKGNKKYEMKRRDSYEKPDEAGSVPDDEEMGSI